MSEKENLSESRGKSQQKNEEFFEQLGLDFASNIETTMFKGLKQITIYQNQDHGSTFLIEMRFNKWQKAESHRHKLLWLRQPWYDSGIYKDDVYRIGKSLFLRKLLF